MDGVVAVSVGVTPDLESDRPRNLLVTDVVLSWGAPNVGPLVLRFPSHLLRLQEQYPGVSPREAYMRLLDKLLENSNAAALLDRDRLSRGEFPSYPSLAALEASYYPRA
jgi:hypothetical protein